MKPNWQKSKFYQNFITKLITNTVNNIDDEYLDMAEEYIDNVKDFIEQCVKNEYIDDKNFNDVILRLNQITDINVLPDNLRVVYFGYTNRGRNILVNPELDKNRRKLYLFHELAHMAISVDETEINKNFNSYFSVENTNSNNTKNLKNCINGWSVIEEGIAQEIAESCFYSSLNKKRPSKTKQQDGYTLGEISFDSNFDYFGLYQPLVTAFGRTLKGVGTSKNDSDEIIQKDLCKKAFNNKFTSKVFQEYNDLGKDNLYGILGNFGVLYNRKSNGFGKVADLPTSSLSQTQDCYSKSLKQMKRLEIYKPEN